MKHRVVLDEEHATHALRRLAPTIRKQLRAALSRLEDDPFAPGDGLDLKRLELDPAKEPVFRLRVGRWRIVYVVRGIEVQVMRVMHRDEGYDWLE